MSDRLCIRCRRRYVPELLQRANGAPVCLRCMEPKDEALACIREAEAIVREGGRRPSTLELLRRSVEQARKERGLP